MWWITPLNSSIPSGNGGLDWWGGATSGQSATNTAGNGSFGWSGATMVAYCCLRAGNGVVGGGGGGGGGGVASSPFGTGSMVQC